MNINDFRHMRRGKTLRTLTKEEGEWLAPIDYRTQKYQRALLLLHGFSSSPAVFRQLLPELIAPYDAVVCPVLPGHGLSLDAFAHAKGNDWLETASISFQALSDQYQQVDVMGLSLGGLLACLLAERFEIHHLYLLAPALSLNLNVLLTLTLAKFMRALGFQYIRNKAGNLCSQEFTEISYRQLPVDTIIEILTLIKSYQFTIPKCPTDLFLGKHDEVVNSAKVATLFEGSSNTTIHWLENSAHVLPLDTDRRVINACVKARY